MIRPEYKSALFLLDSKLSLPGEFCIITACNPHGRDLSPAENSALHQAFENDLVSRGTELIPITGTNPTFSHREPGFAIPCSLPMGLSIARRWHQAALYHVQHLEVTLVDCTENTEYKLGKRDDKIVHLDKNIHAAARLGRADLVEQILTADPSRVHEPGLDGQLPLHFAGSVEMAELLLNAGAQIDARDVDHESTAAQYMLGDRPEITRFLISQGAKSDILMATALGDESLVEHHLTTSPDSIRSKVSDEYFPMVNLKTGGTIYQWILGWYVYPHQVALKFGHKELFEYLMGRSPLHLQLTVACCIHDRDYALNHMRSHPNLRSTMPISEQRQLAHSVRNNDTEAALLMLDCGYPTHLRSQHNATPLHWACWHGNVVLVERLLKYSPDLNNTDNDFHSTPLGWANHGAVNGWFRHKGDYQGTIQLLLKAA